MISTKHQAMIFQVFNDPPKWKHQNYGQSEFESTTVWLHSESEWFQDNVTIVYNGRYIIVLYYHRFNSMVNI